MKKKVLSEDIIKALEEGLSFKELLERFKVSNTTIANRLKEAGISTFNYKLNENAFKEINSEESAYWLGFLYADGCLIESRPKVELALMEEDREHLIKFANFLQHKRAHISNHTTIIGDKTYKSCRYTIQNKIIYSDLIRFGCIPKKSLILKFPDISIFNNKELVYSFIRGYVDGDGCIWFNKKGKVTLEIMGTSEFLKGIQSIFPNMTFGHHDNRRPNSNTYRLIACSTKAIEILDKLYKNANIYLDRKYKKYKFAVQ